MRDWKDNFVFGLDIGTRSIVGTVGYRVGTDRFVVIAQVSLEHKTRAVIDGQIHDIPTVVDMITQIKKQLEEQVGGTLTEVSIAAAGRVLKTKTVYVEYEMSAETRVTTEHIHSLDSIAVEKAYEEVRAETDHKDKHFYCVGYSPIKYYLNGYPMEMIEKHMASSIGVEMIATFLPDEVVEGLYSAVEEAGLHVASLTLEPIAAINLAIPERFRLLNIALVDVGAGTSDISIVKDGSIIAFGMMPLAGDEITEGIAKKYLVDFETAEKIKKSATKRKTVSFKNVLGESYKLTREEVQETAKEAITSIVKKVSEKIIELNGGNSVSAVFVVGGGGKMPGFTEIMAECLSLPENRVSIRGAEVLQQIDFSATDIKKDSTLVTPIGICMEYYEQKSNFVYVKVNEERVKLYDNGKVTVLDACIHAGFSQASLFPSRGNGLTYSVNGELRENKGRLGEAAVVHLNDVETNLNELVHDEDKIRMKPATQGDDAIITLGKIPEYKKELQYTLFGKVVLCPTIAEVNGRLEFETYEIQEGDSVQIQDTYTVKQLLEFMGMAMEDKVLVNGKEVKSDTELKDGSVIEHIAPPEPPKPKESSKKEKKSKKSQKNVVSDLNDYSVPDGPDPLLGPVRPLPAWAADLPISNPAVRPMQGMPYMQGMNMAGMSGMAPTYPQMPVQPQVQPQISQPTPMASGLDRSIQIEVNGQKVKLPAKSHHVFVDVFDAYPFDLTKAGGKKMVSRLNGRDISDFTTPVHANDSIDLYWEK